MCTRASLIEEGNLDVGDMNQEIVRRVISEIKKIYNSGKGIYFETLGLGEPLLYNGLFDLFREIKDISSGVGIVLVTNGILLDEARCRKLISLGVNEVNISLNAASRSGYKQQMGLDAYDTVCRNIENLIKLRNESGKRLPSVFIQYLDYNNNQMAFQADINKWLKIMKYKDKCYVHPILNQAGFVSMRTSFNFLAERHPCPEPLYAAVIKINGDIYPCCASPYSGAKDIPSLRLGNIMADSIVDQLDDKRSRRYKIIESMRKDNYSQLPECARCNTYKIGCNCYFKLPKLFRIRGYKWM